MKKCIVAAHIVLAESPDPNIRVRSPSENRLSLTLKSGSGVTLDMESHMQGHF